MSLDVSGWRVSILWIETILSQLQADDDDSTLHNDFAPYVPFCTPRKGTGVSQESNDDEEPIKIRSPDIKSLQTICQ